jgi:hypothetical protein
MYSPGGKFLGLPLIRLKTRVITRQARIIVTNICNGIKTNKSFDKENNMLCETVILS